MNGEEQETQQQPRIGYRGLYRTAKVPTCTVSIQDLRRLYNELNRFTEEALNRYLDNVRLQPGQTEDQLEMLKDEARRVGGLTVIVIGAKGEQIIDHSIDAFSDENRPARIATITFDSALVLQNFNVSLPNRFRLVLDFTEPPGFTTYNPWENPTPNNSSIEVTQGRTQRG